MYEDKKPCPKKGEEPQASEEANYMETRWCDKPQNGKKGG